MLRVYDAKARALVPAAQLPETGWADLSDPTAGELELLAAHGVPPSFPVHALDINEIARVLRDDGTTLVTIRVPRRVDVDLEVPYRAEALGVIIHGPLVITLSRNVLEVTDRLLALPELEPNRPIRFLLQLVMLVAEEFLEHVGTIERVVNELEGRLRESLANQEVLELLKYQKGLTHFTTALRSDRIMLERIGSDARFNIDADDGDLLEEVLVELRQAIATARVSADILGQMMDAFASIISNNLNVVMKVLTAVTVVMTPPMLLASLYGMNVRLPGQSNPVAFAGLSLACVALAALVTAVLWRRRWI